MLGKQLPVLGVVGNLFRVQGCDTVQCYKVQLTFMAIAQMLVQRFFAVLGEQLPRFGVFGRLLRVKACTTLCCAVLCCAVL